MAVDIICFHAYLSMVDGEVDPHGGMEVSHQHVYCHSGSK